MPRRRAAPPPPPAPPRDLDALTWVTGFAAARGELAAFTHLIRGDDDPERQDIRLLPEHLRDRGAAWRRQLAKRHPGEFRRPILALLAEGPPRTWNAVGVLLLEKTADCLFRLPPEAALWELVYAGLLEHTMEAPVLFRPTADGRAELAREVSATLDDRRPEPPRAEEADIEEEPSDEA